MLQKYKLNSVYKIYIFFCINYFFVKKWFFLFQFKNIYFCFTTATTKIPIYIKNILCLIKIQIFIQKYIFFLKISDFEYMVELNLNNTIISILIWFKFFILCIITICFCIYWNNSFSVMPESEVCFKHTVESDIYVIL